MTSNQWGASVYNKISGTSSSMSGKGMKHGSLTAVNLNQYVVVLSFMVLAPIKFTINYFNDQKKLEHNYYFD